MLGLPHLSGTELMKSLRRLGYRTRARSGGLATMSRRANTILVPETATLSPAVVGAILRAADVEPLELLRAMEAARAPGSKGAPAVA